MLDLLAHECPAAAAHALWLLQRFFPGTPLKTRLAAYEAYAVSLR